MNVYSRMSKSHPGAWWRISLGIPFQVSSTMSDEGHGYIVRRFKGIVLWDICVPFHHIPSSLCGIHITPYSTFHVLLRYTGLYPCRFFLDHYSVLWLSGSLSWSCYSHRSVRAMSHPCSYGSQRKSFDVGIVRYAFYGHPMWMTMNTFLRTRVLRSNYFHWRFCHWNDSFWLY